jgi:DNA polymerase III subunit delta
MVAVKAGEVESTLKRADVRAPVLLLYGPDTGLVSERARAAAERAVEDPADPFQLIRIDGDAIASDPARLADEASTIGLFGGRRAIWVKPTSRNIAPALDAVLAGPIQDTIIVVEAGDLAKSSPLRTLCEKSPKALALPCYPDSDRDLGSVIDETLRAAGLTIARDTRAALVASLGGDRLATRGELAKLALYARGQSEVTLDDIDAVISDVSSLALDSVVDGAFGGDFQAADEGFQRLMGEGTAPSLLLGGLLRHALALLSARIDMEGGRSVGEVTGSWRGLHFRRRGAVERQLGLWRSPSLTRVVEALQAAVLNSRRSPDLGAALAGRTLLDIAGAARRAKGARAA